MKSNTPIGLWPLLLQKSIKFIVIVFILILALNLHVHFSSLNSKYFFSEKRLAEFEIESEFLLLNCPNATVSLVKHYFSSKFDLYCEDAVSSNLLAREKAFLLKNDMTGLCVDRQTQTVIWECMFLRSEYMYEYSKNGCNTNLLLNASYIEKHGTKWVRYLQR